MKQERFEEYFKEIDNFSTIFIVPYFHSIIQFIEGIDPYNKSSLLEVDKLWKHFKKCYIELHNKIHDVFQAVKEDLSAEQWDEVCKFLNAIKEGLVKDQKVFQTVLIQGKSSIDNPFPKPTFFQQQDEIYQDEIYGIWSDQEDSDNDLPMGLTW